mmetsp:Transcript_38740/g.62527  ORF Transcript_38740/g.62527 Transcript_38740/m.62527 type:complete len:313 (-) Transcript_38740:86-1024(-)
MKLSHSQWTWLSSFQLSWLLLLLLLLLVVVAVVVVVAVIVGCTGSSLDRWRSLAAGAMGLLARFGVGGGGATPLQADLKRVTESNVIEVPKDVLTMVVEATRLGEEERKEIMMHLRECLAEPQGKRWRRMYAGLVLAEELLKFGAPELLVETSEGRHFDLVQRLSLLEKFECTSDMRVQNMVRTKASALRAEAVPRLETAAESSEPTGKSASSSRSPTTTNCGSSTTSTSASSSGFSYNSRPEPKAQMILNGIVSVGHCEDTDSDSDTDANAPKKAVAYRTEKKHDPPPPAKAAGRVESAPQKPAEFDLLGM